MFVHSGKLDRDDDHDQFLAPFALILVRRPIEQVHPCQAGGVAVLLQVVENRSSNRKLKSLPAEAFEDERIVLNDFAGARMDR